MLKLESKAAVAVVVGGVVSCCCCCGCRRGISVADMLCMFKEFCLAWSTPLGLEPTTKDDDELERCLA